MKIEFSLKSIGGRQSDDSLCRTRLGNGHDVVAEKRSFENLLNGSGRRMILTVRSGHRSLWRPNRFRPIPGNSLPIVWLQFAAIFSTEAEI